MDESIPMYPLYPSCVAQIPQSCRDSNYSRSGHASLLDDWMRRQATRHVKVLHGGLDGCRRGMRG